VMNDIEHHSDDELLHMIHDDFSEAEIEVSESELRAKMAELLPIAHAEVMAE